MGQNESSKPFPGKVIPCGDHVGHSDVSTYIRDHDLKEDDRRLLQGCYDLFETKPDFVWRNCAIEVICPSVDVKFVSGDQSNQYVLRFKEGDVWSVAMKENIRTKLHAAYDWLLANVKGIAAVITGITPVAQIDDSPK